MTIIIDQDDNVTIEATGRFVREEDRTGWELDDVTATQDGHPIPVTEDMKQLAVDELEAGAGD